MERLRRQYERPETLQPLLTAYLAHVRATYGTEFPQRVVEVFERAIALDLPYLNILLATIFTDTDEAIRSHLMSSANANAAERAFAERFLRFAHEMCTWLRASNFDSTNAREIVLGFSDTVADAFLMRNDALISHVLNRQSIDDSGEPAALTAETLAAARFNNTTEPPGAHGEAPR